MSAENSVWIDATQAREALVSAGRRLYLRGLVSGRAGNLSVRGFGGVWATPTMVSKGDMAADAIVALGVNNEVVGEGVASSEVRMHTAIYRAVPQAQAVVHAHPIYATVIACLGEALSLCITAEGAALGPVARLRYVRPGGDALAEAVSEVAGSFPTILLAQHGAVVWDRSLEAAVQRMETLEHVAHQWCQLRQLVGSAKAVPLLSDVEARAQRVGMGFDGGGPLYLVAR